MPGSEINFFWQAPTGDWKFFFQSANGKMWSPKSVNKIFHLQRNTNLNFWSPRACRQNIWNWCDQESNQCWNHLLTTLTELHFHLLTPREYQNLHVISLWMFHLHLVINYRKISEHLWTPHRLNKYSWRKNARGLLWYHVDPGPSFVTFSSLLFVGGLLYLYIAISMRLNSW